MNSGPHFPHEHILDAAVLSHEQIDTIFEHAAYYLASLRKPGERLDTLRGKTVVMAFFERSTRTKVSFEIAARRLSADVVSFEAAASSLGKGESLLDTVRNIEAMHINILVMRHSVSCAPHFLASRVDCNIINAGDGEHQHPTQGLLDAFTLQRHYGSLQGLRVCIVGDILHSRVARSNIDILKTLGAELAICGPGTLLPHCVEAFGVRYFARMDDAVRWANVVNILRIQRERMQQGLLPSMREFSAYYGLKPRHLRMNKELAILHPGPINRGIELDSALADSTNALILEQVECGVAIRMALLALLAQ